MPHRLCACSVAGSERRNPWMFFFIRNPAPVSLKLTDNVLSRFVIFIKKNRAINSRLMCVRRAKRFPNSLSLNESEKPVDKFDLV